MSIPYAALGNTLRVVAAGSTAASPRNESTVLCDTTAAGALININLPDISGATIKDGDEIAVANVTAAFNVTVTPGGTNQINGLGAGVPLSLASLVALPAKVCVVLRADKTAAQWRIVNAFTPPTAITAPNIFTGLGFTTPVAANYSSVLQAAGVVFTAPDGIGVWSSTSIDGVDARYLTTPDIGSGKSTIVGVRGNFSGNGGVGLFLREDSTGKGLYVGSRCNTTTAIVAYEMTNVGGATGTVDFTEGGLLYPSRTSWFKYVDDGVNITLSVSYEPSPNGEPAAAGFRTLFSQVRRRYGGSNTGLAAAGWTQSGFAVYDFVNTASGNGGAMFSHRSF